MKFRILLTLFVVSAMPLLAEAAGAPRNFRELVSQLVNIISVGTGSLFALALVIYMWNIASNMVNLQKGSPAPFYRAYVVWGIIILFVMVSIWGILRLLLNTFFQGGQGQQPPPLIGIMLPESENFRGLV